MRHKHSKRSGRSRRTAAGRVAIGSGHRSGDRWGYVLIAIGVAALLGIAATFLIVSRGREVIDAETFCPVSGPKSVTVVLIDATDSFDPLQARALHNRVNQIQADIERGGALEIYLVAPIEDAPLSPLIKRCNPGRYEDASMWSENPRLVERNWRDGFRVPVDEALRQAEAAPPASVSPILASLKSVALTAFAEPRPDQAHRLILISDLLEHTSKFSLYRSAPDAVAVLSDPTLRSLRPPLDGVDVELLIVDRGSKRQTPQLGTFWEEMISAGGGRLMRRGPLVGLE